MSINKIKKLIMPSTVIVAIVIIYLLFNIYLVSIETFSVYSLIIPIILIVLLIDDYFLQSKHALRMNFPIIARFRYIFESVRPEFRQYFFEGEIDGKPFNRRQRSIVYQRAKNVKQTISFGMQDEPERIGYEWAAHSMFPKKANPKSFRIKIGNEQCKQPYNCSIFNISAMSYGALSRAAVEALNKGAQKGNFAHNTGEGGVSEYHLNGGDLIWQIGTGYFGCRDDKGNFSEELFKDKASKIEEIKMIEIKVSQGAKPGHGGLLPSEKNTKEIAAIRHIEPFTTVHSPSAHTAFTSTKEFVQFIGRLKELSGGKPVGFKICIGRKKEFFDILNNINELNIIPDFITVDGAEGGTGAAPLEFIDYMGMSLCDALSFVSQALEEKGLKQHIKIIASGKIITAFDIAKVISLGADACNSARGMMFALGCIQALRCDSGKCPVGVATQEKGLYKGLDVTDKSVRVSSFHKNTMKALADFIGACGCETLSDLDSEMFYKRTEHNQNETFKDMYFKNTKNYPTKPESQTNQSNSISGRLERPEKPERLSI